MVVPHRRKRILALETQDLVAPKGQDNKALQVRTKRNYQAVQALAILGLVAASPISLGAQSVKKTAVLEGFELFALPQELARSRSESIFGLGPSGRAPIVALLQRAGEADAPPQLELRLWHWLHESWQGKALTQPQPADPELPSAPARLGIVPWEGERPTWTYLGYFPGQRPAALFPSGSLDNIPLGIPIQQRPLTLDLNRDFESFLVLLPIDDSPAGGQALPRAISAPGTDALELELGGERWVALARGSSQLVPWDLDLDQNEDLIVLRGEQEIVLLLNDGDDILRRAPLEMQPRGANGGPLRAHELRLGPIRGQLQAFVCWGATGQHPRLGFRQSDGQRFELHGPSEELLSGLRVLDARILDLDLDGVQELLLLAQREAAEDRPPEAAQLLLFQLPGSRDLPIEAKGKPVAVPGAYGFAVGDVDGDGAMDLLLSRSGEAPLLFRNLAAKRQRLSSRGLGFARVQLLGGSSMPHAVGAYVELYINNERIQRRRWPPLDPRDQLLLSFSWPAEQNDSLGDAQLIVTWPDGLASEHELQPGQLQQLRR
jgi:hypothetical protein